MQQWNGLLRKEWVTMKGSLLVSALFAVATMLFLPMVITRFWGAELRLFEVALDHLFTLGDRKCVCTGDCIIYHVGEGNEATGCVASFKCIHFSIGWVESGFCDIDWCWRIADYRQLFSRYIMHF